MSVEHLQAVATLPEFSLSGEVLTPVDRQVLALTWDSLSAYGRGVCAELAFQPEGQPEGRLSNTFRHELAVGGLILMATGDTETAVAAALHDAGKRRPEVRRLISSTTSIKRFSDQDLNTLSSHARFGGEDLQGAVKDPQMDKRVGAVAVYHHTAQADIPSEVPLQVREMTGAVRVADVLHSILLDWTRKYKAQRWLDDGWIDAEGVIDMDAVMAGAMPESEQGKSYLGVAVTTLFDAAVAQMPSTETIYAHLEDFRRRAA